jgi:hypothetical protein
LLLEHLIRRLAQTAHNKPTPHEELPYVSKQKRDCGERDLHLPIGSNVGSNISDPTRRISAVFGGEMDHLITGRTTIYLSRKRRIRRKQRVFVAVLAALGLPELLCWLIV